MKKFYSKDEIFYIKETSVSNIDYILDKLNLQLNDRGEYFNGKCPVHSGDGKGSFSIRKECGTWKCWTKSCHEKFGSDIVGLVRAIKKVDFTTAVGLLADAIKFENVDMSKLKDKISNLKFIQDLNHSNTNAYKEDQLDGLTTHGYLLDRGFTRESMNTFEIGYNDNTESNFYNRMILPVRNSEGQLVGWTGRLVEDKDKELRWKHEGKLHKYLYNLHKAKPFINESRAVFVFEGPLKVIRAWESGIRNCVACFGTSLSDFQEQELLSSGAFTIILCMDNDDSGSKARVRMRKQLEKYFYVEDFIPSGDFDKLSIEQVKKELMENQKWAQYIALELLAAEK